MSSEIKLVVYGDKLPESLAEEIKDGGECAACHCTTFLVQVAHENDGVIRADVECAGPGCSQPLGTYRQ